MEGKGIVINEPSVVAIDRDTNEIFAVGNKAKEMVGRTPGNIIAIRPLKDGGVIADFEVTERLLKDFLAKATRRSRWFRPPRVVVSVPSGGVTEVEKKELSSMPPFRPAPRMPG